MQDNRLGRLLKHKRVAILVTLEELAMASGVSEVDLEQIESGEYVPLNGCLERIARALGIETGKLSSRSEGIGPPLVLARTLALPLPEREYDKSRLQQLYLGLGQV